MESVYSIPLLSGGTKTLTLKSGSSAVFVGANGSGKSRLGSYLELQTKYINSTHRVGAQRALQIPTTIQMMDPDKAHDQLLYGHLTNKDKHVRRWGRTPATFLLNDYQHLLISLYSEKFEKLTQYEAEREIDPSTPWPITKLAKAKRIWDDTIVTRNLSFKGASLWVKVPGTETEYPADEMSDGERVLLYLIGQCLEAPPDGVLIIDEPKLHLHKAVLTRVWDIIEAERPDCLFIYLTHDIEFSMSRTAGQKYAVRSHDEGKWDIIEIPEDQNLPEDVTARILGSRKPILFIEGTRASKDVSVFGKVYNSFTVIPAGSCEDVIHLTNSYNARIELHHLACMGIIDRDGRGPEEVKLLRERNIYVIDYAEIENLLLADRVLRAVAQMLEFEPAEADDRVERVKAHVFKLAERDVENLCVEFTKRRLHRTLSRIGFEATSLSDIVSEFQTRVQALDIEALYAARRAEIEEVLRTGDYGKLLALYENKGAIKQIGGMFNLKSNEYPEYVLRHVGKEKKNNLLGILQSLVPDLQKHTAMGS